MQQPVCNFVCANLQGPKDKRCRFYHNVDNGARHAKGEVIQLTCGVKFYFYFPKWIAGKPSATSMAIISYGEHTHPPPPPRKISALVKEELIKVIKAFGAAQATARRIAASPILPIMLDGKLDLS